MGHAHSTNSGTGGAADSAGGKEGRELLQLLKRHVVTGDTPFHRAVRGSSSGPAARRRLEGLCDAVLAHHHQLARHFEQNGQAAAFSRASWLGCSFGSGDDDAVTSQPWPTDGLEGLRRLLDLQNQRGQTALHLAAELGYPEAVELLLERGANPWLIDRMGAHMPIHVACVHARLPCVKLLLDDLPAKWRRSPQDESISYVEAPTVSGFTPLHCAVASSDVACIRAVLAHHPRLDQGNRWDSWEYRLEFPRGTTPMHVAASKGSQDAAKELLRYFNSALLASQGRLAPVPSPSVFGGQLPLPGTRAPTDPRQAVNSLQQLPWQVAYSMHLRSLAEMLHPSMPLTYFFPAPPVMTLQSLASAVLRQKLMHTLEAAQQADERQRQQQQVRLRLQLEQEEEQQQRQALRQQQLGSSLQAVRSMPISLLEGGRQGSGNSGVAPVGPMSLGAASVGTRAAAKALLGSSVGESVTSGMQRIKQALLLSSSSSRTSGERLPQQQQAARGQGGERPTSAPGAADGAYSGGSGPLSAATTSAVMAAEDGERDAQEVSAADVALANRKPSAVVCTALVPEAVAAAHAAQAHRLASAMAKPGQATAASAAAGTAAAGLSRRSGAVAIASSKSSKLAATEYHQHQNLDQPPSSCPANCSPMTKKQLQQQEEDKPLEQQQRPPLLVNSVSCRGMVVGRQVAEEHSRLGEDDGENEEEQQCCGSAGRSWPEEKGCADDGDSAVLAAGSRAVQEEVEEEEDEDADVCAVCLDGEARMEVVPCRHCLCAACSHELVRNMSLKPLSCPLCRQPVRGFGVAAAAAARFARHHCH